MNKAQYTDRAEAVGLVKAAGAFGLPLFIEIVALEHAPTLAALVELHFAFDAPGFEPPTPKYMPLYEL